MKLKGQDIFNDEILHEDDHLAFSEEIFKNVKKNKRVRLESKNNKFNKRVKLYNATDSAGLDHSKDYFLKNTSTPCSCYICRSEKHNKKDRQKNKRETERFLNEEE